MNDCYFEKKDWRLCKAEVSYFDSQETSSDSHFERLTALTKIVPISKSILMYIYVIVREIQRVLEGTEE